MGILQRVPALVKYPDCGSVWHGQFSVCAGPIRLRSMLQQAAVPSPKTEDGDLFAASQGGGLGTSGFLRRGGMSV